MNNEWQTLAAKLAAQGLPVLAGALMGPAGASVGAMIAAHLDTEPTPSAVNKAVVADPDALLELKQLEQEHFKEAVASQEEAIAPDPADVQRIRDASAARVRPGMDDMMRTALALVLVPAPIAVLVLVGLGKLQLSTQDATLLGMLVGYLLGEAKAASQFYFGTSLGSKKKSVELAELGK